MMRPFLSHSFATVTTVNISYFLTRTPRQCVGSLGIPMMSISHSDLMPIRAERSDAGLSQCETVIDIRQEFSCFSLS